MSDEPKDDKGRVIENAFTPTFPKEYESWICGCQNMYLGSCCREPLTENNWTISIDNDGGYGEAHIRHFICPGEKNPS